MSWAAYIDTIKSYGNVSQAAIHGLDGSPWASSPEVKVCVIHNLFCVY